MKSPLFIIGLLLCSAFLLGGVGGWFVHSNVIASTASVPGIFNTVITDREMERELVRMDIEEAGNRVGLSARQQSEYLVYLDEAATQYNIPMILVHAVIYTESSYDPSVVHPQITVRGKATRALGLGGIVWEYNHAALISEGIATSKLELTEPRSNLMASALIIRNDVRDIFAKNPALSEDRFFDELIRRYYGAYDNGYKNRMLTKIKDMASKQWIRRVVKTILLKYKSTLPSSIAHNDSTQAGKVFYHQRPHLSKVHKTVAPLQTVQVVDNIDRIKIRDLSLSSVLISCPTTLSLLKLTGE